MSYAKKNNNTISIQDGVLLQNLINMNVNTRIIDLTVGELVDLLSKQQPAQVIPEQKAKDKWLVYGLKGLAELFGCSKKQAYEIKNSGVIDSSISQYRRTIIVDANLALELMQKSKCKKNN